MKHLLFMFWAILAMPVSAQSSFTDMAGQWIASGQVASRADDVMQRSRCRVKAQAKDTGNDLLVSGRCAIALGRSKFSLRLLDDGSGRIRAAAVSTVMREPTHFTGRRIEHSFQLAAADPIAINGNLYAVRLQVMFDTKDQFTIKEWRAPPETNEWRLTAKLVFTRKGGV